MKDQGRNASPTPDIRSRDGNKRPFLQPLAVVLVSLLFALLFLGMALMDLRQIEGVLLDMLQKRALHVVESIEKNSQDMYNRLMRNQEESRSLGPSPLTYDETFAARESVAKALIDLGRYIDFQSRTELMPLNELQGIASSENIYSIALLDKNGAVELQSGPVPPDFVSRAKGLAEGTQQVAVHLFDGVSETSTSKDKVVGFVGVVRQEGKGAVLLILDRKGLEYWGEKISIQQAVDEQPRGGSVVYMAVEDAGGRILSEAGRAPEEKVGQCLLTAGKVHGAESPMSECVRLGDIKFMEVMVPFKLDGQVVGKARVGLETRETVQLLSEKRRHIFFWTGLMMLIGILVMVILYQTQNRHISKLQTVGERLHQAERLSSLAKLGAEVAHEVRNPLNAVSMATQRLERDFAPSENGRNKEEFRRITRIVREEIRRIDAIIEDFLGLSRKERLDLRERSLPDLLDRVVFLIREETMARGIQVQKQLGDDANLVLMDANKMEQALLNIIRNAVDSIAGDGSIVISLEARSKDLVGVKVRDTGPGIPSGTEQRIFDPFYTTKPNGSGLGLSIAREIIRAHGGKIVVQSDPNKGTTFEVLLPRSERKSPVPCPGCGPDEADYRRTNERDNRL
jgi:signal transduction histidine kinase